MIRIAISGACGRMGRALYDFIRNRADLQAVFGVDTYCGDADFPIFDSFEGCTLDADVVVDFSSPSALDGILNYAESTGARVVLATTGYSTEQLERIKYFSKRVAIFQSANMSLGVSLLGQLTKDATRFLKGYDVEVVETHHNKKADAPSGTALTLARDINSVLDGSLSLVCGRTNGKRGVNDLTIHSIRGGTAIGKHSVMFFGGGENLTLTHEAESKDVFICGTLRAISFIITRQTGIYTMKDLLAHCKPALSISTSAEYSIISFVGVDEKDITTLFKSIYDNNLPVDDLCLFEAIDGSFNLSISFKGDDNSLNTLASDITFTRTDSIGKITLAGVEAKDIQFEILRLLKSVGAKIHMLSTSESTLSVFVDEGKLVQSEYALKSYFKI